jgi:MraZ protein
LRRAFFSGAEDLIPDKQGRILISQRLREYAQIEIDVIVAGVNLFVELWRPTLWDEKVLQPLNNGEYDQEFFAALQI